MLLNLLALCVVIIIKIPYWVVKSFFKHRALMVVALIVVIVIGAYSTINKPKQSVSPYSSIPIPTYQQKAPPKDKAPQIIQTFVPDTLYYVSAFTDDGLTMLLPKKQYYYYDSDKWKLGAVPLPLIKSHYKDIKVYTR